MPLGAYGKLPGRDFHALPKPALACWAWDCLPIMTPSRPSNQIWEVRDFQRARRARDQEKVADFRLGAMAAAAGDYHPAPANYPYKAR